jgi:hypothetical protein
VSDWDQSDSESDDAADADYMLLPLTHQEGELTEFPEELKQDLQTYCTNHMTSTLPCATKFSRGRLTSRNGQLRTYYGIPEDELLQLGHFRYGNQHSIIVAQGVQWRDGKAKIMIFLDGVWKIWSGQRYLSLIPQNDRGAMVARTGSRTTSTTAVPQTSNGPADRQPRRHPNGRFAPRSVPASDTASSRPTSNATSSAPVPQTLPNDRPRAALTRSAAARTGRTLQWQPNNTGESVTGAPVEITDPVQTESAEPEAEAEVATSVDATVTSEPNTNLSRKRDHSSISDSEDDGDDQSRTRNPKRARVTTPPSRHISLDARQTSVDPTATNVALQRLPEENIEESIEEDQQIEQPAEEPVEQPVDDETEEERLRHLRQSISVIDLRTSEPNDGAVIKKNAFNIDRVRVCFVDSTGRRLENIWLFKECNSLPLLFEVADCECIINCNMNKMTVEVGARKMHVSRNVAKSFELLVEAMENEEVEAIYVRRGTMETL